MKVREIDVFLRAVITAHLADTRAKTAQRVRRKTRGHDYARRESEREMVCGLMFVVHHRDRFDSREAAGEDLRIGIVTDREIEAACPGPTRQFPRAGYQVSRFTRYVASAVRADHMWIHAC